MRTVFVRTRKTALGLIGVGLIDAALALFWPTSTTTVLERKSLLDQAIPQYEFVEHHEVRVHARPREAYSALQAVTVDELAAYPVLMKIRSGAMGRRWRKPEGPSPAIVAVFSDPRPENNPELCLGRAPAEQERCVSRILNAWTSDMSFVIDRLQVLNGSKGPGRFTGRLDLTRVGAFGHSFGGAAVAEFCRRDPRCRAGVNIDGAPHGPAIQAGLKQPFMLLLSDHSAETGPETKRIVADMQSLYDHLPPDSRLWVDIPGSFHFMFSDDGAVRKSALVRGVVRLLGRLRIDARRQLAVTSYCLRTFFAAHLNGPAGTRPAIPSPLFPEVRLVRQGPLHPLRGDRAATNAERPLDH